MKKFEWVNVVLALIGLTADTIGLYIFFNNNNVFILEKNHNQFITELVAISIYCYIWLVASWIILRLYFKKLINKGIFQRRSWLVTSITLGVGLLLLPVNFYFNFLFNTGIDTLVFFPWIGIYLTLRFLLPFFYSEMYQFITRKGKYLCINEIGNFKKGDQIEIVNLENIHGHYNYVDQKGDYNNIYYGHLLTSFEPIIP